MKLATVRIEGRETVVEVDQAAGLAWRLIRQGALLQPARILVGLLALQVVTGLSNVVLDWPIAAAMLHSGGAGAMVAVLVWMGTLIRLKGHSA